MGAKPGLALAGGAQLVGASSRTQKATGPVPGPGTYRMQPTDASLSLSPSLLKQRKIPQVRQEKKKKPGLCPPNSRTPTVLSPRRAWLLPDPGGLGALGDTSLSHLPLSGLLSGGTESRGSRHPRKGALSLQTASLLQLTVRALPTPPWIAFAAPLTPGTPSPPLNPSDTRTFLTNEALSERNRQLKKENTPWCLRTDGIWLVNSKGVPSRPRPRAGLVPP